MKTKLILAGLLASAVGLAQAQEANKVYLVKGDKVVGTYPRSGVDYITFANPEGTKQEAYTITANSGGYYNVDCPATAEVGSKVMFTITMTNPTRRPATVKYGDYKCTYIGHDDETYYYMFVMPGKDVTISMTFDLDMHLIDVRQGENTTLVMYNSSDGWDLDPVDRVYDNYVGKLVKFMWYPDYGYEGTLKVVTENGDDVPYEYVTDDEEFGTCWQCMMPDEPIAIKTYAKEKTDYKGRDFVGEYKGYPITLGNYGVYTAFAPTFSLTLGSNTAFHAANAGSKEFAGCYSYNDADNTFRYLDEYSADAYGKKTYGVSGKWFEGGDAWVLVNDLNNDKPDNNRYYFVSKNDFTYTAAASDTYGSRFLIEMQRADGASWYYFDKLSNTVQPVSVTFTSGTSISALCEAVVADKSGTPLFHFSRTSAFTDPVFTLKGSEAGSYAPQGGTGDNLELDGFGNATCGTTTGTYTIEDGVVTVADAAGKEHTYVIDTASHTYTASAASVWDGSENFAAATYGTYDSNTMSMGMVAISLNRDYNGNAAPGQAKVQVTLTTDMYETKEIISNTVSYTYDASKQQLTLTGLLVGTANGRSTERINVTFDVNADKTKLTCNEDKVLRAVSGGDTRYINIKGLALTAR